MADRSEWQECEGAVLRPAQGAVLGRSVSRRRVRRAQELALTAPACVGAALEALPPARGRAYAAVLRGLVSRLPPAAPAPDGDGPRPAAGGAAQLDGFRAAVTAVAAAMLADARLTGAGPALTLDPHPAAPGGTRGGRRDACAPEAGALDARQAPRSPQQLSVHAPAEAPASTELAPGGSPQASAAGPQVGAGDGEAAGAAAAEGLGEVESQGEGQGEDRNDGVWTHDAWRAAFAAFSRLQAPAAAARAFATMCACGAWAPADVRTANMLLDALCPDAAAAFAWCGRTHAPPRPRRTAEQASAPQAAS
jgi:hypothetical protein